VWASTSLPLFKVLTQTRIQSWSVIVIMMRRWSAHLQLSQKRLILTMFKQTKCLQLMRTFCTGTARSRLARFLNLWLISIVMKPSCLVLLASKMSQNRMARAPMDLLSQIHSLSVPRLKTKHTLNSQWKKSEAINLLVLSILTLFAIQRIFRAATCLCSQFKTFPRTTGCITKALNTGSLAWAQNHLSCSNT